MKFLATVHTPMYDHNDKKYLRLVIPEKCAEIVRRMHSNKDTPFDPLNGRVLTVKVPFRYRRVMCRVEGQPIQSLVAGDEVHVEIDFKGYWATSGYSWVLSSCSCSCSSG
jgi:hypothetical protein